MSIPQQFDQVSVVCKANVYFDGKVISHSVLFTDGSKKTLGLIYPGSFFFGTGAAEIMEVVAGSCSVRLKGESEWKTFVAGTHFKIPAQSGFDITVDNGICEYICSFV
jgi:uncharacterized protein YaiE (UPF0345 family)